MRFVFIMIVFFLVFGETVAASDAYSAFAEARAATFANGVVQLNGCGTIEQKPFEITAQIGESTETRLRITTETEKISLILNHGKIYNENREEQKVSSLFAKLVAHGLLDLFFIIEILDGRRGELYRPHMSLADGAIQMNLSPAESLALYEKWTGDLRGTLGAAADGMTERELQLAESVISQILSALEADVRYSFEIDPSTKKLTQINISSKTAAPTPRTCQASLILSN